MSEVGEIVGRLRLDDSDWNAKLDAAEVKARELGSVDPKIRVRADTAGAVTGLTALQAKVDTVAAAVTKLQVSNDRLAAAEAKTTIAERAAADLRGKLATSTVRLAEVETTLTAAQNALAASANRAARAEAELTAAQHSATAGAVETAVATDTLKKSQKAGQQQAVNWQAALIGGLVAVSAAAPPVAAVAVGLTGAFGAMGVAGVLGIAGIARGMKTNDAIGQQYRGTIGQLLGDVHELQDSSARGLLPGVEASTSLLSKQMPALNAEVGHFAGMLGANLPVGLDAVVTLLERAEPLLNAAGGYLGRMVTGLDSFAHSNGYSDFLTYSIKSLPEVEKFLGDTVHLVGDFLAAWAPLGTQTLPLLDHLITGLDDVVKTTGPLVPGIVAVVGAYNLLSPAIGIVKALTAATTDLAAAEAGASAGGVGLVGGVAAAGVGATQVADHAAASANYESTYRSTSGSAARKRAVAAAASAASMTGPASAGGGGMAIPGLLGSDGGSSIASQTSAQQRMTTAVREAAAAEHQQADAVATMRAALDSATGALERQIAVEDAASTKAIGLEGSYDGARDAIAGVTSAVKSNGTSLDQNTSKGRANRESILAAVSSIKAHGAEMVKDGSSTAVARVAQDKLALQLLETASKAGISKRAAEQYIDKLLGVPKDVSTSVRLKKDEAEAKLERYRSEVQSLDGYTATVYVSLREVGLTPDQATRVAKNQGIRTGAQGGTAGASDFGAVPRLAGGGTISGPGTAATDTAGRYQLANGEEVVSNLFGGAAAMRPLLKAVSAGKVKSPAQAAMFIGGGSPEVHVHMAPKIPGYTVDQLVDVRITGALAAQEARAGRTQRMGWQGKGLLAAPNGA